MIARSTIGDAWLYAIRHCMDTGRDYTVWRGSYEGQRRRQLDSLAFLITNPGTRPLAVENPYTRQPVSNDEQITTYFCDYLINPEKRKNEQYTYAQRLAPNLEAVVKMLHDTPNTNQATINVGRYGDVELSDPPCLRVLSWKLTPNGLQLSSFWRSWDLFNGLPMNLGGLQLLNEAVAEWAGYKPGYLVCYSDGAHVYKDMWGNCGGQK